jgi:hypothetical protein
MTSAKLPALVPTEDWQEWADRIGAAWRQMVGAIIETGRLLIEAKAALPGQFESMVQLKLPFTPSTARRLMMIAANPVLSNRAHVHVLPPSWGTLYELTKLPAENLRAKIQDGSITPKLERKDVARLRDETRSEVSVDGKVIVRLSRVQKLEQANAALQQDIKRLTRAGDDFFNTKDTASDICRVLAYHLLRLSPTKRKSVVDGLHEMLARLEAEHENGCIGERASVEAVSS